MREIKFRAWDKETKSMSPPRSLEDLCIMKDTLADFAIMESKLEFMQYTGLKDENGREIYEGDIARMVNPYTSKLHGCEVIFAYAQFAIIADDNFIPLGDVTNWEVIGNIYENPELLEAK